MPLNAYIHFNGQCEEAFKFYAQVLGGKIERIIPYEGSPAAGHVPAELLKKVMHARLTLGDDVLMGSDVPQYQRPAGFSLTINSTNPAEADRIFQALSENGKIEMPIAETFWAQRFGMLVDRYGIPWMVNCEKAGQAAAS